VLLGIGSRSFGPKKNRLTVLLGRVQWKKTWNLPIGDLIVKRIVLVALASVFSFASNVLTAPNLHAWGDHPLVSLPVLLTIPEVRNADLVRVESMEDFIQADQKHLEKVLLNEEAWTKQHLPSYPLLPKSLTFTASGGKNAVSRFSRAIRINGSTNFPLYLELVPGEDGSGRRRLTLRDISFLDDTSGWRESRFVALEAGEMVRPLDVAVSATAEPDLLGLDIGLFEDNGTDVGKILGLGRQPFGDPHLELWSQAPFHMGFYHESPVIYALAGFLKKTYPEYRIHLYKMLSELAFQTGHPYWGWRFMGWGLHYLADLTNPYHATPIPGLGTARALWISALDMLGIHGPKADVMRLSSNRHFALEQFAQIVLRKAYLEKDLSNPILRALRPPEAPPPYDDSAPRLIITRLSHDAASKTDKALSDGMPRRFVSDPAIEFGKSDQKTLLVEMVRAKKGQSRVDSLILMVATLVRPFAVCGPGYVRAVLQESKTPQAR
jgi:hypothetical protein